MTWEMALTLVGMFASFMTTVAVLGFKMGHMSQELKDLVAFKAREEATGLRDAEERGKLHGRLEELADVEKKIDNLNLPGIQKMYSKWPEVEKEVDYMKRKWGSRGRMPAVKPGTYFGREDDDK